MNLQIFRSIKQCQQQRLSQSQSTLPQWFHGISASTHPPPETENHHSNSTSKWISQLHPRNNNVAEAAEMLERLSRLPTEKLPELIVFHHDHDHHPTSRHEAASSSTAKSKVDDVNESLTFLREILPLGAQFCEAHPTVGSSYKRLNAQGNPLNDHVVGICHSFPHYSVEEMAVILDVFLPTRLAVSPGTIANNDAVAHDAADNCKREEDMGDVWEAVVNNTDMLILDDDGVIANDCSNSNNNNNQHQHQYRGFDILAKHVWNAQEQDGVQNTFAVCNTEQEARWLELLFENRKQLV